MANNRVSRPAASLKTWAHQKAKAKKKKKTGPEKETKRTTNLTKFPGWTNDYNDKR